jgi:hypothetical protein
MLKQKPYLILTSCWFLGAITLLLLNDFILKSAFHNWFTGKLSDFAGLFFLPLFLAVFFPKQIKTVFLGTALFFIFWKSSLSAGLIDFINLLPGFHYGRVIDYTDLIALSVLPFSHYIYSKRNSLRQIPIHPLMPILVCAFALLSTSQLETIVELNEAYYMNKSVEDVRIQLLNIDPLLAGVESEVSYLSNVLNDTVSFNLLIKDDRLCQAIYLSPIIVGIDSSSSRIYFSSVFQSCREKCGIVKRCDTSNTKEEIMEVIESNFIDFL